MSDLPEEENWAVIENLDALLDVEDEITRQREMWGKQNHPSHRGPKELTLWAFSESPLSGRVMITTEYSELAERLQNKNDEAEEDKSQSWSNIFLEEVFEAVAEEDPDKRRTELIQAAAVAIQWASSIERNEIS